MKERINKTQSMLVIVLSSRVYAFSNGILMQRLRQELHKSLRQRSIISFFMKCEKKGRCFLPIAQKTVHTKISRLTKKYITLLNTQTVISYKDNVLYRESKVL
jgi:hypothetical protein